MQLLPAIDIRDGHAVRLTQGRFDAERVYDDDPYQAASRWVAQGAAQLHVVDLDGARSGEPVNLDHVARIARGLGVPVQLGGGLRSLAAIEDALAAGAQRCVLGTAAFDDAALLDAALAAHGDRLVVSVDAAGGNVATAGWTQVGELDAVEAIARLGDRGVESFVYTNTRRDGMLEGPDLAEVERVAGAVRGRFVYSGGIGSLDDLRALAGLGRDNLAGVIVGSALYERRFDVAAAQAALTGA